MTKPLLIAALAIVGLSFTADSVQAGRRCCRARQNCGCASACNSYASTSNSCSTGCNAIAPGSYNSGQMTDPNIAPLPPQQTTSSNAYQSYSYEPAAAPVANSQVSGFPVAPQSYQQTPSSFQFRGDRKALGNY